MSTDDLASVTGNAAFLRDARRLLKANTRRRNVYRRVDVARKLKDFEAATRDWRNYPDTVPELGAWIDRKYGTRWGNLHPTHAVVVDACVTLQPDSVCEVGAGAGVVAKYVYASLNPHPRLVCVDGARSHMQQMRENFRSTSPIPPHLDVNAEIVEASAQRLPFSDRAHDLTYTCTALMHMPFPAAVLAICEIARTTRRYVVHAEGYHTDGILFSRDHDDLLIPDYRRIYKLLGFKTLSFERYPDPFVPGYEAVAIVAERSDS